LFVAVNLPAAERERIWRATAAFRRVAPVRWTAADSFHVTLKFLGNVDPARVPAVSEALRIAARQSPPFELALQGFGAFPDWRRPRIFWVGAEAPGINVLQRVVEDEIGPLGFPGEARPFHPHVTVGRASRDLPRGDAAELARMSDRFDYSARLRIETVELMQSHTTPNGSRYSVVATAGLGNGEGWETGA